MIHILLTPPGQQTSEQNLGVLHVGCIPEWFVAVEQKLVGDGWTVTVVPEPEFDFPEGHELRERGQRYLHTFIDAHPEVDPRSSDN